MKNLELIIDLAYELMHDEVAEDQRLYDKFSDIYSYAIEQKDTEGELRDIIEDLEDGISDLEADIEFYEERNADLDELVEGLQEEVDQLTGELMELS